MTARLTKLRRASGSYLEASTRPGTLHPQPWRQTMHLNPLKGICFKCGVKSFPGFLHCSVRLPAAGNGSNLREGQLQQNLFLVIHNVHTGPVHSYDDIILGQTGACNMQQPPIKKTPFNNATYKYPLVTLAESPLGTKWLMHGSHVGLLIVP